MFANKLMNVKKVYQKRLFLAHFFYSKCHNSKVLTPKIKCSKIKTWRGVITWCQK